MAAKGQNIFNASDFKAKCLAILDKMERRGMTIAILKRGRPVAELRPITKEASTSPQQSLIGSVKIVGDILSPIGSDEELSLEEDLL